MKVDDLNKKLVGLFFVSSILTLIGLIFIYSSSSVYALEHYKDSAFFFKKQLMAVFIGIIGFLFCKKISIQFLEKNAIWLVVGGLGITCLGFIPRFALKVHGSSRWISIAGMSFQPSEFLIPAVLFFCAAFLAKRTTAPTLFTRSSIPGGLLLGIVFIILLKQPDFGAAITLFSSMAVLLFVTGLEIRYLLYVVLAIAPFIAVLVYTKAYRLQRIMIFLNPWADPRGKGFQIIQSLIAIGSGQILGQGISASRQKFFYLPMQHTDFIFSIIAEETGLMGGVFLILLFILFCYFGIGIVMRLKHAFGRFLVLGFISLITVRAVINLMVASGLLPTKGLGLPFISYGGSAIICIFCMLGLIANVVKFEESH